MNPTQKLSEEIKNAMRARDQVRLDTLRYLSAQIKNAEIDKGLNATLTEDEFIKVVQKQVKNSAEAIEQYRQGNRQDLIDSEHVKVEIMKEFLPKALSEEELKQIINELKAENPNLAIGPLTGLVMKAVAGRADGRQVSTLIRQLEE
jgi:uncharacterized protein YqeY